MRRHGVFTLLSRRLVVGAFDEGEWRAQTVFGTKFAAMHGRLQVGAGLYRTRSSLSILAEAAGEVHLGHHVGDLGRGLP